MRAMSTDLNLGRTQRLPVPCYRKVVFKFWTYIHILPLSTNETFTRGERSRGIRFYVCTFQGCKDYFSTLKACLQLHLSEQHHQDIQGENVKRGQVAWWKYVLDSDAFMDRKLISAKVLAALKMSPTVPPPDSDASPSDLATSSSLVSSSSEWGTNLSAEIEDLGGEQQKKVGKAGQKSQDTPTEGESVKERDADKHYKDLEKKRRDFKIEQLKLQNALAVSDATVNTFRKLNVQKQHKIDELERMVESLTAKTGNCSSPANEGSYATEQKCVKLRSEIRCLEEKLRADVRVLKEKNMTLMANMEFMSDLLRKNFLVGQEILAQSILQVNGDHNNRSWRSGAAAHQQQQHGHYQDIKKASTSVKAKKYDEKIPPGFGGNVDANEDIGDNESESNLRRSQRLRTGSFHEDTLNVFKGVSGSGSGTAGMGRIHKRERAYHGKSVYLGSGAVRDRTSDEVGETREDAEGRTKSHWQT